MALEAIRKSPHLLSLILDSVTEHIAVLDSEGYIRYVNRGWREFGQQNGIVEAFNWIGVNYLRACSQHAPRASDNSSMGQKVAQGIRDVVASQREEFHIEYPCHSPREKRWFMMNVTRFIHGQGLFVVISHQNITQRKLAEAKVIRLSRIDDLTRIPNRRSFDEFINKEWRRCNRMGAQMSLAMLDIDHFKRLNDSYGHQYGDICLKKISRVLAQHSRRPGDHCARYGGEEFALIFSDTGLEPARQIMQDVCQSISLLELPEIDKGESPSVTVSVGLVSAHADHYTSAIEIVEQADALLYQAKENGRNRICAGAA